MYLLFGQLVPDIGVYLFVERLQLLPRVLFNVIVAREGADCISKEGLKFFYEKFAGLSGAELEKTTEQGFKTATAVSTS